MICRIDELLLERKKILRGFLEMSHPSVTIEMQRWAVVLYGKDMYMHTNNTVRLRLLYRYSPLNIISNYMYACLIHINISILLFSTMHLSILWNFTVDFKTDYLTVSHRYTLPFGIYHLPLSWFHTALLFHLIVCCSDFFLNYQLFALLVSYKIIMMMAL